jgi:hypothetical protein
MIRSLAARRSAVEARFLLYVALDARYLDALEFGRHYEQAGETRGLIGGFRKSLLERASHLTPGT